MYIIYDNNTPQISSQPNYEPTFDQFPIKTEVGNNKKSSN